MRSDTFDVVIVGARVRGCRHGAAAGARRGRVLVLDKGGYGTDTLSTHALMRGAVMQLHRWGVLPAIVDGRHAGRSAPRRSATASRMSRFPIEPRYGVGALYAPRRALLDRVLVDAAATSGAECSFHGTGRRVWCATAEGRVRGRASQAPRHADAVRATS